MKRMIESSCSIVSRMRLIRSSNSPRYLVPATMLAKSREKMRLSSRLSGTLPVMMRWARPSAMAVLPTPGAPMRTGLFLVRRLRIWMTRLISFSLPMTGSIFPCLAHSLRSRPNWDKSLPFLDGTASPPSTAGSFMSSLRRWETRSGSMSISSRIWTAMPLPSSRMPASICSVPT